MFAPTTLVLLLATGLAAAGSAADQPLFPMVITYDAPQNVANVSGWLERPAGGHGFVRSKDGRLATDAGPIRFWATNLCFEACFPSHQQAQRLAARLAALGINCVRMHHMDQRSIWGKSPDKLTIDAERLDRLDFLIYQLKLHGIYTNLNLHVSRSFDEAEGFTARQQRPLFDKGLDNFELRMIELQKEYARDLLAHVNPYTKTPYTTEPAVAFVEISNEDSLFQIWNEGGIDRLPDPYATTFRKLWNAWLRKKYGGAEPLRNAWNVGRRTAGEEMLANGQFAKPLAAPWQLERDDQTTAQWSLQPGGPEGGPCLRIAVAKVGRVPWNPQLSCGGFAVKKDTLYTLKFSLRGDAQRSVGVNCQMAHEPWAFLGLSAQAGAGTDWKQQSLNFVAQSDDPAARIVFTGLTPGTYEIAKVSLRSAEVAGLAPNQRLEDDGVAPLRRDGPALTEAARHDFVDFLWETERDYWWGVYRFLKDDLGVKALAAGTQLGYSSQHLQAGLDFLDAHSYWEHPHFPGRDWDRVNWYVRNVALVNSPGGTLSVLANRRVADMPYTVSEYNHPEPNQYAAEGFPMIAAFGAFQGWDAIYSFAYSHGDRFEPRRIESFFDIKSDTTRLVHMPACAALFVRGDAATARQTVRVPLSQPAEMAKLHETLTPRTLLADNFGLDRRVALLHGVALDLGKRRTPLSPEPLPTVGEDAKVFQSDTGQLRWDLSQDGAGYFVADTPRSKLFTGFVRGRSFPLGNVTLSIGPTQLDWATVSMVCIDGQGFDRPGRILIAATGRTQNKDARLERLAADQITLRDQWGVEPVLCEGIAAQILLPVAADRATFYPLDESGNRRPAIHVDSKDGRALLVLGPEHKTVWYEVEVR